MKILGVWKEYLENGDNPSIYEEKFKDGFPNDGVLKYLGKGIPLISVRDGDLYCKLRQNYEFRIHDFYTDGEYIWTEGLINYYREMHIVLPEDFLQHMNANNYIIPEKISSEVRKKAISICDNHIFGEGVKLETIFTRPKEPS